MGAQAARELLLGLAEEALSGRGGDVVCLEAPEWPPLPASLRRELDGRSVYTRPGVARYATAVQLSAEERLVAHAQARRAPRLPGELAARRLGVDAELVAAQLRERAQDADQQATRGGLRLDQAAAVWHVLTSARTVEVVTGPAGTGKTRVLAAAARAWGGLVFGTATSQNATNELRHAGVRVAANTTRLLADLDSIPPGSLIEVDEGSIVSLAHLAALVEHAARNGCKLVLAGDQEQLAAVEGGGAMMLLAERLGYVQLAEPVRFAAAWEREASLRLRRGDATALDEYDQHGRIRGAPPEQAMDQAVHAYVASYLAGRDVLLMAADWARCQELSARIRDDLIHLGLVDATPAVRIAEGAKASAGDLIICRRNDHAIEAGEPGRALANGDVLRIEAITGGGLMVRRMLGADPATGQRRFTDRAFCYADYQSSDLAYAITGHSAQGATVHTGIALVTGTEGRQWLYPAMTRGTDANLAFVFTTLPKVADPRPGTRAAPELERYERIRREREGFLPTRPAAGPGNLDPREPIAVLADVLDRDGAELSASETRRRNLANADHLGILHAIWIAETRGAREDRYRELVMAALPPATGSHCRTSPGGCSGPCTLLSWPGLIRPRSSELRSPLVTWPAPATSRASWIPGSGSASTRCCLSRRAPGPAASPTCRTRTARLTWPRSRPRWTTAKNAWASTPPRPRPRGRWPPSAWYPPIRKPAARGRSRRRRSAPTGRPTATTTPRTRSDPNPPATRRTSVPRGTRRSSPLARSTGPTSEPCPTAGSGSSVTPTPSRPPGRLGTSARNCGWPGSARATPTGTPSAPELRPTPPAKPATTSVLCGTRS